MPSAFFSLFSISHEQHAPWFVRVPFCYSLLTSISLQTLAPILEDLGKKHVRYGVVTGHYNFVGNALIDTLKEALGEQWTEDVKGAWLVVWGFVRQTMDPDIFSVGQRVKTQFGKGVVAEKRDNNYVVVPHTSTWVLAYGQKPILNLAPNMLKPDDA